MKISLNWLSDYIDVTMPVGELSDLLMRLGLPVEEVIETETDIILDVEVTSNRPDCLGHLGVAREIAAATGTQLRPPKIGDLPTSSSTAELTSVEVENPNLCPRYTARVIRGVKVGASPSWLVERLEAVGLRSINNVVDVTNYVLMEYSQPLHSFDYDKLAEHRIVVRTARRGEQLISIDETRCELDEQMLVIADAEKPVAIAGVMGGLNTEVSDATTNVLVEAARFDPLVTRRTSRKLSLMSESNYRFERGIDPVAVDAASLRACQLILELAGGKLAEGVVDVWARPWESWQVTLRPSRCDKLLGVDTPPERQRKLLDGLGLQPSLDDGKIVCTIPPHRPDLTREADLIEEVARVRGYDDIPVHDRVCHPVHAEATPQRARRELGRALTAAGFDEAVTASFIDAEEAALFGISDPVAVDPLVRRTNNALRPVILPSLLRACKTNQDAGNASVSLYEVSSVFPPGNPGELPAEHSQLAMVTTRELQTLRGALENLLETVSPNSELSVEPAEAPGFARNMAAELRVDGSAAGCMGIVSASVLDYYGLSPDRPLAGAWIRLDSVLARCGELRPYESLAKFPAVRRDLSIIVDEDITWRSLREAIDAVPQELRVDTDYVTTYRGKQIPTGRKSVTMTLTYRSDATTLRSDEVDSQVEQVVATLQNNFSADLRARSY